MKLILQVIKALFRKIEASRTHWDTRRIVTKEYTFDGNINSKETIQIDEYSILVKVADTFPEVSSVTNLSIACTSIPEGLVDEYELSPIDDVWVEDDVYIFNDSAFYVPNGSELMGIYIPSGLYFAYIIDDIYTSKFSVTYIEGELKKLDKKYLPDEVIKSIDVANNAQTTANNAQTTANNAQNTANNAQTTANSKMNASNPVGTGSFSMGRKANSVVGINSHAEGGNTTASGNYSHSEGYNTTASSYGSHAEGYSTAASGKYSHAEGTNTAASGDYSHAEGDNTIASGYGSHAEGLSTIASSDGSHAEGSDTTASANYSHAEGTSTTASAKNSHAEGFNTTASGENSHTEGYNTSASGKDSHAEGFNTIAKSSYQHVQGICNVVDSSNKYAHIVGNGRSISNRSNAHTIDWSGNAWFAGTVEGTALIIPSSTEGSTKKFKITVDDSGTISATEVS